MKCKTEKSGQALVLFGSPNKKGHTAQMLACFLQALPRSYETIFIDTYQKRYEPCTACGFCAQQDGCAFHDMDEVDSLLRTADLLIVATPIYNLGFPSPLKAVWDRTQRYFAARFQRGIRPPIPKAKRGVLLLSCGADDTLGAQMIQRQLQMIYTILNAQLEEVIIWKNTDEIKEMGDVQRQLKEAAAKF